MVIGCLRMSRSTVFTTMMTRPRFTAQLRVICTYYIVRVTM